MTAEFPVSIARSAVKGSAPGATPGTVKQYTKTVGGVAHLFAQASDGTEYQVTPPGTSTANGSVTYAMLDTAFTLGSAETYATDSSTGPFNIFNSARDVITLAGSTTYKMRMWFGVTRSVGTANQQALFGGTATYTKFEYYFHGNSNSGPNPGGFATTNGSVTVDNTSTLFRYLMFEGLIITNAGGTFIPEFSVGTATGASTQSLPSYCELIRLGSSSFTSQGFA